MQFVSKSDTEVVLNVISIWGPSGLMRLDGMFALAIWDNKLKLSFLLAIGMVLSLFILDNLGKNLYLHQKLKPF